MFRKIIVLVITCLGAHLSMGQKPGLINRQEVVRRHNIIITKADSLSSLSVGNGRFAFTVDVTGLQSFPEYYKNGVPLGTQSAWGWHSFPNKEKYTMEETMRVYDFEGRKISYPVQLKEPERNRQAVEYFRVNPHRLQLGNIGLEIKMKDGSLAGIEDIKNIHQQLDLWTGIIYSNFTIEDIPVEVVTIAGQSTDVVGLRIHSELLKEKRIQVRLRFPYPSGEWKDAGTNDREEEVRMQRTASGGMVTFTRTLDSARYYVRSFLAGAVVETKRSDYFLINPSAKDTVFEASFWFSGSAGHFKAPGFPEVKKNSIKEWLHFWKSGAAVDFAGSTDKRAFELERRIVLSQYLTRIQCASEYPPQETGLTFNSWYGRPHLEMHTWHAVHFALWGRASLISKSLDWYFTAAKTGRAIARRQGFEGIRWPKMTDNTGSESPSSIGAFLIWQQPHIIYMAELLYRLKKDASLLTKYKDLVFATADFMASFPSYDTATKKYNLGKGLIPAQERFDPAKTFNPTYELAYWHWTLNIAQQWRLRLGLLRNKKWDKVIGHLAPLPQKDNVYLAAESAPDSYVTGQYMTDHPAVLGTYAFIPAADGLDTVVMKNTFDLIWKKWHWNDTWGWDFPLTAMTATRLNMPDKAIDALLMPVQKNTYLPNGHNYQDGRLTIYLPGNGGLLTAIAMMCAGYEGCTIAEPGFPKDGSWKVKWEGLRRIF